MVVGMGKSQKSLIEGEQFHFADRFMQDHAGSIISDARIAILELIANAYDAGSTKVDIIWPEKSGELFSVTDNGTGMTQQDFDHRWKTFNYDRQKSQGALVVFPPDVRHPPRRSALGQSGKGRHAPFCFADNYTVQSRIDGRAFTAEIALASGGQLPFVVTYLDERAETGHGTKVSAVVERRRPLADDLQQLIGSKFIVDPSFAVTMNGKPIELTELDGVETHTLQVEGGGEVVVHFIDSSEHNRTMRLRGITWWVNGRMVGEPGWDRLDSDGAYLDGRTDHAKRFSFVVVADLIKKSVKPDWTGFHANQQVNAVKDVAHQLILHTLRDKESGTSWTAPCSKVIA